MKLVSKYLFFASISLSPLTLGSCDDGENPTPQEENPKINNIILIIGDGMGPQQLGLLELFARESSAWPYPGKTSTFQTLVNDDHSEIGMSLPHPPRFMVVDSASSATMLATGELSASEMIGLNEQGESVKTVLEHAKEMGKATGLVSNTRLTHATPAAFAAHVPHRDQENEIAAQMLENQVDVMLSGGLRHFIPDNLDDATKKALEEKTGFSVSARRDDGQNLLQKAEEMGYQVVHQRNALAEFTGEGKLLGLFANSGMLNGIEETQQENKQDRSIPTLKEMTQKALEVLSRNEQGFFLMVEPGQIDWAAHNNDAGTMLHEMIHFDDTLGVVYEWAKDRDDTLVIIIADHETGGFGFSYSRSDLPNEGNPVSEYFKDKGYDNSFNFGEYDLLERLYSQSMSFEDIILAFDAECDGGLDALNPNEDDVETKLEKAGACLIPIVEDGTGYQITLDEAKAILTREENEYRYKNHEDLEVEFYPKILDFSEFYTYGNEGHYDLLGRVLGPKQNIIWGTGTHTSTPISVIAHGPSHAIRPFGRLLHHSDVGKLMIQVFKNEMPQ